MSSNITRQAQSPRSNIFPNFSYLEESLKIPEVTLQVYKRAIRNVPWCLDIWCNYLRTLEREHQPPVQVREVFEQALSAGLSAPGSYLQLWLCFIDYKRRKTVWEETEVTESMSELRTVFERANAHLAKCRDDPEFEVSKYWANLEADQFGMMGNARTIWSEITLAEPGRASVWLDYIHLEKTFGDKKHLRKAYQRAVEKTSDSPELIVKSFIQFEREEGSLEAYEEARKVCKLKMAKVNAAREKEAALKATESERNQEKIEKKKEKDKQQRRDRRQQAASEKRGAGPNLEEKSGTFLKPQVPTPAAGQARKVAPPPGFPGAKKTVPPPPGFNENKKRTVEPPPGFTEPNSKKAKMEDYDSQPAEEQRRLRTVFLNNMVYSVNEEQIRECLGTSGPILDVRLPQKPNGEYKGYGYVEFERFEDAQEAIKRDNELLLGRPLYISECNKEKQGPVFKYEKGLEKNKLYISGLDPSVTRQDLQEIFGQFGNISAVRVPTYRNGHAKGIAFVDFEDEVTAAAALVKTDNMTIKTKAIKVALSNPPKRKNEPESGASAPSDVRSLGGTEAKDFGPRGKGRSQLAFTPRSISVPSKPPSKMEPMKFVKAKDTQNGSQGNGDTNGRPGGAGKSNDQFRQMLNKQ